MPKNNDPWLIQASDYWQKGQVRDAGKLIFEHLPTQDHPQWAFNILKLVVNRTDVKAAPIENILHIASHRNEWNKAHDAFRMIRRDVLELNKVKQRSSEQSLLIRVLALGEIAAKVTYNSSEAPAPPYPFPFDENAGWWMAECVRHILDLLDDEEFSRLMWAALCNDAPQTGGVSGANG